LDEFKNFPKYADSFVVEYSTIIMSISQISETLFILAIPFFLKRFGIKQVMLISMLLGYCVLDCLLRNQQAVYG
jgi:NHS family xanthosine MFS transporter